MLASHFFCNLPRLCSSRFRKTPKKPDLKKFSKPEPNPHKKKNPSNPVMKSYIPYSLLAAIAACGLATGQETAYTTPVGYISQTCAANSDTIVSLPLRQSAAAAGALSGAPDTATVPGSAIYTLSGSPGFTVDAYAGTHYVKFTSGADIGRWYAITANTANTITVDLNGATVGAVDTDTLEILKFWTLNELFNPAASTTDPLTTGNAIVASTSQLAAGRRTSVLLPDMTSAGINLAPTTTYYVNGGIWKKQGSGATDFGGDQLWPDSYFIIRNPSAVTSPTTYTVTGEVEVGEFDVALGTQAGTSQDNFVGIPRAVDVALNDLNLGGTAAFVDSTSQLAAGRRDQLLVFNNAASGQNKAPVTTYYRNAGLWKKQGGGATDFGADVIPAGSGFIIRKYQSGTGATANWDNTAAYSGL
jgi:uncharacterized protein (TIGR02597 family)